MGSDEYLAKLGFDTSDADAAIDKTITLLGHLGNQFDSIQKNTDAASRALSKSKSAVSESGTAVKNTSAAWDKQNRIYEDYLRGQDRVNKTTLSGASAQEAAQRATEGNTSSLISQRYALYDVASTYGAISAALLGAAGYALKVGADFESSFTQVQRTSDASTAAVGRLREGLVDMTTEVPRNFDELSNIAALGNQLGIASKNVEQFTGTTARFATVSGMTVESTATAFGSLSELLNLSEGDFEKLGSAIAYVARTSVATEPEIVALAQRLAASATNAGFTAQEVIALSGAFASLRVAPERAQGVMEVYFNRLNSALANGGDELNIFAQLAGTTTDEIGNLVATDPNKFFRDFAAGIGSLDTVSQTQALDALGLSGIRAGEVFGRISGNLDVFDSALVNSNKSYAEGTELQRQYAMVLDDVSTQFQLLVNSVNALIASLSGGALSGVAGLLEVLRGGVNTLRDFMSNEDAQRVAVFIGLLGTILGLFFAYRAGVALATASTYALTTAQAGLAASGTVGGLRGLIGAMVGYRVQADLATGSSTRVAAAATSVAGTTAAAGAGATAGSVGLTRFGNALKFVGKATVLLALLQVGTSLLTDFGGSMQFVADALHNINYGLAGALDGLRSFIIDTAKGIPVIGAFAGVLADISTQSLATASDRLKSQADSYSKWAYQLPKVSDGLDEISDAGEGLDYLPDAADEATASFGDMGNGAAGAAAQVRTLVDYASDLQSVVGRAFEIRFGGGQGMDQIDTQWNSIRDAIAETNQQINEYRATMMQLAADKSIREYWLMVAENYGDALRAGQLRAELADIDNDLAKTSQDLTKAQEKNSKGLSGNSQAAIDNRGEVLGLVQGYQSYINALASSGVGQEELKQITAQLKSDFIAQATQLGYNSNELGIYAAAFDDVTVAINGVPRNITVSANTNPAIQALNELQARLQSVSSGVNVPISSSYDNSGVIRQLEAEIALREGKRDAARAERLSAAANEQEQAISALRAKLGQVRGFRAGGDTGGGNPWDVKGVVHAREFVLNERGRSMFSPQELNDANRGIAPQRAGAVQVKFPSVIQVELSPTDREIMAGGGSVFVAIGGDTLASSTDAAFADDARRGGA